MHASCSGPPGPWSTTARIVAVISALCSLGVIVHTLETWFTMPRVTRLLNRRLSPEDL